MKFLQMLFSAADALQAGKSLTNSTTWKRVDLLTTPLLVILAFAFQIMGLDVDEATINKISGGLASLAIILHGYFVPATTDKLGLSAKK